MDMTLGIPCRADEPGLRETLESLWIACQHAGLPHGMVAELMICINGVKAGEECRPLTAVRDFCNRQGIVVREVWLDARTGTSGFLPIPSPLREEGQGEGDKVGMSPLSLALSHKGREEKKAILRPSQNCRTVSPPGERGPISLQSCTILLTEQLGKPRAWNAIWKQARSALVLFCDADVRVEQEAVYYLYTRLQRDSRLSLVAAREVPVPGARKTLWSRMGAIAYRFDFGNAGGRLYLIRKDALPGSMPEDLLLEDAWLTVAVGKQRVAKELRAQVFFLLPVTWRDYFAERVRTEGGKLQIRRAHSSLLTQGPIARYRWSQFWQEIAFQEYPLVLLALAIRGLARAWAWVTLLRRDFYGLYHPFPSTKGWTSAQQ